MQMNYVLRRSTIIWLLIPFLVASGCATRVPPRPPREVLTQPGRIGVVSANIVPEADAPKAIGKAAGATKGAAAGLGLGLLGAASCFSPLGVFLIGCIAGLGTPILMAAGAAEGAKWWIPGEVEEEAKTLLNSTLHHGKLQSTLREHVIEVGQDQTHHAFAPFEEGGGKAVGEQADYRHLASQGIDTVLEVSVTNLGFVKGKPENVDKANEKVEGSKEEEYKKLPFSLIMSVGARLIRASDNKLIAAATYNFTSLQHKWSEWVLKEKCSVEDDCSVKEGQVFGEAIADGHRILAQQVVDEFFSKPSSVVGPHNRRIEKVPSRVFDSGSVSGLGVPEVKVRLATSVEVPQNPERTSTLEALDKIDFPNSFPNRLRASIEARLKKSFPENGVVHPHLEVVIQRYGFAIGPDLIPDKPETVCPLISAYIQLRISDQVRFKDRIFWEPYRRSIDIPPPQCASPADFAAQGGKLARQTLKEATEVLAAVVVRRLK